MVSWFGLAVRQKSVTRMTTSVLKQDPNAHRKGSNERLFILTRTHSMQISKHRTSCKKLNQKVFFLSFSVVFDRLSVVHESFWGLIKGISPKMCILCARVKINKRSFEPFLCLDLAVSRGTSVRIRFGSPFSSKVAVCGHCLVTSSFTINETLKWLSSLPILMPESFWW